MEVWKGTEGRGCPRFAPVATGMQVMGYHCPSRALHSLFPFYSRESQQVQEIAAEVMPCHIQDQVLKISGFHLGLFLSRTV